MQALRFSSVSVNIVLQLKILALVYPSAVNVILLLRGQHARD